MAEPAGLQTMLTYLTLISVPVGVFYHIMTLNNTRRNQRLQLETRETQLFMDMYNRFQDDFIELYYKIRDLEFDTFEEYWDRVYEEGEEFVREYQNLCAFYEGLGVLVREGKLNIRWVALLLSAPTRQLWEVHAPFIDEIREATNVKRGMAEWEYLYNELMRYLEEHPELKS